MSNSYKPSVKKNASPLLEALLEIKGLTYADIALRGEIPLPNVYGILGRDTENTALDVYQGIAQAFEISLHEAGAIFIVETGHFRYSLRGAAEVEKIIVNLMALKGIPTYPELARKAGVSLPTIHSLAKGKYAHRYLMNHWIIAGVLGINLDDMRRIVVTKCSPISSENILQTDKGDNKLKRIRRDKRSVNYFYCRLTTASYPSLAAG